MSYAIEIAPTAQKQLEKLNKTMQERILAALERIRVRPYRFVRKPSGSGLYSLRVGDYRIILDIQKDRLLILVIKIGHRQNIHE